MGFLETSIETFESDHYHAQIVEGLSFHGFDQQRVYTMPTSLMELLIYKTFFNFEVRFTRATVVER